MKIYFTVWANIYVIGKNPGEYLRAEFEHNAYQVSVLVQAKDLYLEKDLLIGFTRSTIIELSDENSNRLESLLQPSSATPLLKLLTDIRNRVVNVIRNFGSTTHIPILKPDFKNPKACLQAWDAHFSSDGKSWNKLVEEDIHSTDFHALSGFMNVPGNLRADKWPIIEDALRTGKIAKPEQEFLTNAQEYLEINNLRLALIEAIIGLEIVLDEFLIRKLQLSSEWIDELISRIGLSRKVDKHLKLTLSQDDFNSVKVSQVLRGINWRNQVMHRVGDLPDAVDPVQLKESILSIINLCNLLAKKREEIALLQQ